VIKNLKVMLPEYGKIKAGTKGEEVISGGGKKFRLPKKLDHFIITTTERDNEGNLILDTDLMEALKKSDDAIVDKEKNLIGIPIRLLYNSIDLNFQTRYACYVGGKCVCSGNGETGRTRDGRDVKCPCKQLAFDYEGKDKCKANGRLVCLIDGASIVGACHVLRTTSINTVNGSLAFIQAAASGMLAFLPLHLILKPKTVTIPSGAPSTVYVSSIVYRGSIEQMRDKALMMAKEKAQFLIEMDTVEESARELIEQEVESEQEQLEVQQEFYPDSIDAEVIDNPAEHPAEQKKENPAEQKQQYYILLNKKPVPVESNLDHAKWQESISDDAWKVKVEKIKDIKISTVFLGSSTGTEKPPLLFETLVSGGKFDGKQKRYAIWEDAEKGHKKIVDKIKSTSQPKPPSEEPPVEQKPEPEEKADDTSITKDQKREIVALKKKNKITDPAVWAKLLEPFEVKTANNLTEAKAKNFIEVLSENPPF